MRFLDRVHAMSRGLVVLDENISGLEMSLRERNITVIVVPSGWSDEDIKLKLLPHRIFVTKNSKHFIEDATSYEYGIIAVEKLGLSDKDKAAKYISQAISKNRLWSKIHGFFVTISSTGKTTYKDLIAEEHK
jgi:hypothetical protein